MCSASGGSPLAHGTSTEEWDRAHEKIRADEQLWCLLRLDGIQPADDSLFEMRTCPRCQSSILRPISREQAEALFLHLVRLQAQVEDALTSSPCPAMASQGVVILTAEVGHHV